MFEFIATKWPKAFMGVATVQAAICLAFEAYVFAKFNMGVVKNVQIDDVQSQYKTIPTFLALFIFGFIYELVLVWDALRMKNTIQVIGLCIANPALLIYTAIQIEQIQDALATLAKNNALEPLEAGEWDIWSSVHAYLVAIPIIIGICTLAMIFIAWKLYQEFAWDILKQIGADYRMKKRFLHYQVYIALLKFDFFFFLGFTVQLLVIAEKRTEAESYLTIAAIPVTIAILLMAAFFTRREIKSGMILTILLYFGGLSYFLFKLVRIYQPGFKQFYSAVQRSLTAFAVLTILLIILTIINAFVCMSNFGNGLKAHLLSRKGVDEEKQMDANSSIGMNDIKPQMPSRMTID